VVTYYSGTGSGLGAEARAR